MHLISVIIPELSYNKKCDVNPAAESSAQDGFTAGL
jgi:hypothetical protein